MKLENIIKGIKPLDYEIIKKAQKKFDNLVKPVGSLGRLEDMVCRVCGICGSIDPDISKKTVIIMCSDNGVLEEKVAQSDKGITSIVTQNFLRGITGVNVFTRFSGSDIMVVDIGVDDDINQKGIVNRKIRKGTWNIAKGPAMTRNEAEKAVMTGVECVKELYEKGVKIIGTGEMGIGNTTTSSAVASVLTGKRPEDMVGKGAGLDDEGLKRKIKTVKKAIEINKPDENDALDVVSKLGGFDIAGLAGCFLGGAYYRIPVIIDGFISAAAALAAVKIAENTRDFIFTSHASKEPGNRNIMETLKMEPYLEFEMRLGEGTGAALMFNILDAAFCAYREMGTFNDANIEKYEDSYIKK